MVHRENSLNDGCDFFFFIVARLQLEPDVTSFAFREVPLIA